MGQMCKTGVGDMGIGEMRVTPFNNAFVVSFKLRFFKLNLLCLLDKCSRYNLHIKKNKFCRYNYTLFLAVVPFNCVAYVCLTLCQ